MAKSPLMSEMGTVPGSGIPTLAPLAVLRDLVELGKPRITLLVLFTSAVGLWLAPGAVDPLRIAPFLAATGCLVASANTLNCWIERETDARMRRTRNRPLPAGRLEPQTAFGSGLLLGVLALGVLLWSSNVLTTALGAAALLCYVLIYTPMKQVSPWAVVVGAIPGAIPPLMGTTAQTGSLSAAGGLLFGILFFWQLPHFIAISIYLKDDYRRGGLQVLPLVSGERAARRHLFACTLLLVLFSLSATPLGVAGGLYTATAILLGAGFLYLAQKGLRPAVAGAWARKIFGYTLIYLTVLVVVLVLDAR